MVKIYFGKCNAFKFFNCVCFIGIMNSISLGMGKIYIALCLENSYIVLRTKVFFPDSSSMACGDKCYVSVNRSMELMLYQLFLLCLIYLSFMMEGK